MRLMGFLGLIALAGSVVPGLAGQHEVPAAAATSACTGPFTQVPSPSPGTTQDILNSTATAGAHGQWAVGRQTAPGGELQNLIMFDGGHGWAQVASPDPGTVQNELTAVSASGPADAWAAGRYFTDSSPRIFAPQTLHWDGSSWTLVPFPALHHEIDTDAVGIVDISPDDAWLVSHKLRGGPLIAHWDGAAWSLVTPPAGVGGLRAVAASGPGDVWAVGWAKGPSAKGVILHYNGRAWTKSATLPGIGPLNGITSISRADAWAVGAAGEASAAAEWNGSAWRVVPTPALSTQDTLYAVSGTAKGGVWAVGSYTDFSRGIGYSAPMALHWNGTAWTAVPATGTAASGASGTDGYTGTFLGVATPTASSVVAVGSGETQGQSLVAHLCAFTVRDTGFAPSVANLSGAGAAAYWVFPFSDKASHDLADGTGFNLFDSGTKAPGSEYAFAFPASGTYTVTDKPGGASEKVRVPMELVYNVSGRVALRWASQAPPPGARFEIQKMAPGSTKFAHLWITTKTVRSFHKALPAGTYKFRSRVRNPATGVTTGWSPTLTVTVS
jgi:hypothetical protein